LEGRALLIAAYWRTNLTMRQPAPLFEVAKSAAVHDHQVVINADPGSSPPVGRSRPNATTARRGS
jgi:hypothetical protein